jgi:hypothetical protein
VDSFWLRSDQAHGIPLKKGKAPSVPPALQSTLDSAMASASVGTSASTARHTSVPLRSWKCTLEGLVKDYNSEVSELNAARLPENQKLVQEVEEGALPVRAALGKMLPLVPLAKNPANIHRFVQHMKNRFGWVRRPVNTSGVYLQYSDPRMQEVRDWFAGMLAEGQHAGLILNFDQLWRAAWRPPKRVWRRLRETIGLPMQTGAKA